MVKIGWLSDKHHIHGGAELSDNEFIAGRPYGVDVIHCPPHKRPPADIDIFVLGNIITYGKQWIESLKTKPVIMHIHDLWPYGDPVLRRWILENAHGLIFNSPTQRGMFRFHWHAPTHYVYPPVDICGIKQAVKNYGGERKGVIFLGRIETGKGVQYAVDYALQKGQIIDFYGQANDGFFNRQLVPPCRYCGELAHEDVPATLAKYSAIFYMPMIDDLCGRAMIEAQAAGLEIITHGLSTGSWRDFIDWYDEGKIQKASRDFWGIVLGVLNG